MLLSNDIVDYRYLMWWKVTITISGEENFLNGTSRRSFADFRSEPDTWDLSRRLIRSLSFFNSAAGKTLPSASIGATFYTWNYKNEP